MNKLFGKVALITGASSGIGAGTAVYFASLGCKLSLCGRNSENLKKVADECLNQGLKEADLLSFIYTGLFSVHVLGYNGVAFNAPISQSAIFVKVQRIVGDLSKEENCKIALQKTMEHHKQLDILVNSAGIFMTGDTETTPLETYDKIMNINVRSLFYMMQLAIPHLVKTKGNIVNLSSCAETRSFPALVAYCMSKATVDQLTKCAALELASRGVRVNSVNPGVIITDLYEHGGMSEEQYKQFLEHSKETHALGRCGTVDEVTSAIAFLASDQASFITGVNLPIDCGRSAMCPY